MSPVKLSFTIDLSKEESNLKAQDDMQEETREATEGFPLQQWLHLENVFDEENIKDIKENNKYLQWTHCKFNMLLIDLVLNSSDNTLDVSVLAFDSSDNTLDVSVFFND